MEIKELRAFVLLAEHLHYSLTAELLNLTQPALSKQIYRLEEFLGSPLFTRSRHGTRLTTFGKLFLQEAKHFISNYDRLCLFGQEAARGHTGILKIGFGLYTIELVPALIVQLRQHAPGIEISLKDLSTADQVTALRSGEIDIGFLKLPTASEFESLPVLNDRLAIISSANDPSIPPHLWLADCVDRPFVMLSKERSLTLHSQILQICGKYGYHPHVVQEVPEMTTALALVQAGMGISVLPCSLNSTLFPGITVHPQAEPEATWTIGAAWRKGDTNPALHRFLALLNQAMDSQ